MRGNNDFLNWVVIPALVLLCGMVWLCADISAQQTPSHAIRRAAPRLPCAMIRRLIPRYAEHTCCGRRRWPSMREMRTRLKSLVTPEALSSL